MRAPPTLKPSPGTIGSKQQHDADEEEAPLVAGEVGRPLDDEQRGDEHADRDDAPRRLQAGEVARRGG